MFLKKTPATDSFFNKVAGPATFLIKRPWHKCISVNFAKFLRRLFTDPHRGTASVNCLTSSTLANNGIYQHFLISEMKIF